MIETRISVIICTCNRAEHLRRTLDSMAQICVPGALTTELIVVDNASTDNTEEVVKACDLPGIKVRYVYEAQQGLSFARNRGIAEAQGEIILFTDDDVRLPFNWITGMSSPIIEGASDALAGGVRFAPHLLRDWMEPPHRWSMASTERLNAESPQDMVGANMAFSRKVISHMGVFDTDIGSGALGFCEDSLFSEQIQEAGFRIGSALDVEVEHHFQENRLLRTSFLQAAKKYGQSFAYLDYHWKHNEPQNSRLLLIKRTLRLNYWRATRRQEMKALEGIPLWEMGVLTDIHYHKQLMIERQRPRNYEKRGLVKLVHTKNAL